MIQNILYALLLIAGFPAGLYIANLTKEELKNWKTRFIAIIIIFFIIAISILFTSFEFKVPIVITLFFGIIVFLTLIWKSK